MVDALVKLYNFRGIKVGSRSFGFFWLIDAWVMKESLSV